MGPKPYPKDWRPTYEAAGLSSEEHVAILSDPETGVSNRPSPIADLPRPRKGGVGRVQRPKECHHRACLYVLNHAHEDGIRLVFGTYLGKKWPVPLDLSWVELPGNVAFDGNTMEFYRADDYRDMIDAQPIRGYTAKEAAMLMTETGHTGPWTAEVCREVLGYEPQP